jgi:hypothetical protein
MCPCRGFLVSGYKTTELIPKYSNTYQLWSILRKKQLWDIGNCVHIQQYSLDPDERGIISQLLYAYSRWILSAHVLKA